VESEGEYMIAKKNIVLTILLMSNLVFLWILLRATSESRKYKEEMVNMTQYAAALEVLDDIDSGVLRLYELRQNGKREYANRNEGPFEIWVMPYYPIIGKAHIEEQKAFVEIYNSKMKTMHEKMQRKAEKNESHQPNGKN